jgi:hypothetical protein
MRLWQAVPEVEGRYCRSNVLGERNRMARREVFLLDKPQNAVDQSSTVVPFIRSYIAFAVCLFACFRKTSACYTNMR